ncbi:MAG TPA: cytochrome P450 [Streptosporangiaceae bacterium]|jgi:cytochrome P450|nr:cytochrome P450 [Streptosporangiaceae bacterium]
MSDEQCPRYPFRSKIPFHPPHEWAVVRERAPVVTVTLPSGDQADLVTRYEEARTLLGDTRFSRQVPPGAGARIADTADGGVFNRQAATGLSMFEGSGHTRWRRLMARSFTIRRVDAMRPGIRRMTDRLVGDMIAAGPPGDIVTAIGDQLPVGVIGDLLGVPAEDRHRFRRWSDTILTLTRFTKDDADAVRLEFGTYLAGLVEAKRRDPGDDLMSELVQVADEDDGRLDLRELVITAMALLVAGHETTANMIGKMMAMLLADRRRFQQVVNDPAIVPSAVEEVLRYDMNPSIGVPRFIGEDIEVGGRPIPGGTTVIVSPAIANRDPRKFPHPEHMDLHRPGNQHLSFGAGPHFCLGAPLARAELQIVLQALAERLPELRLAVDPAELAVKSGLIVVGLEKVPVQW